MTDPGQEIWAGTPRIPSFAFEMSSKDGTAMSTDTTADRSSLSGGYGNVRFRPRNGPPDRLFGPPNVNYPGHDGRPMADNTLQDEWIDKIKGGLDTLFRDDPDVFVASNLMWYPVEGNNRRRLAPDVMVAFGRPKGYRDSYVVHEEGVSPQVFFEILSPSNRKRVMDFKRRIYELYGVEEYYVFDPYKIKLEVWLKENDAFFRAIPEADTSGWVSPRLGIRFELAEDMTIYAPDGQPFLRHAEVAHQREEAAHQRDEERQRRVKADRRAKEERLRAKEERLRRVEADRLAEEERQRRVESERRAEEERLRAEEERLRAEEERLRRVESERRAEEERLRADGLVAKLRALGIDPDE
jgi:Uma2 family endonuclease